MNLDKQVKLDKLDKPDKLDNQTNWTTRQADKLTSGQPRTSQTTAQPPDQHPYVIYSFKQ